ncbi:MAG: hypothetical protein ACRD40_01970 [Candidatus Acidiferrales bacterium]
MPGTRFQTSQMVLKLSDIEQRLVESTPLWPQLFINYERSFRVEATPPSEVPRRSNR